MSYRPGCITLEFNPNQVIQTTESTLVMLPFFSQLLSEQTEKSKPCNIFLDRDMESVRHILEIARNSSLYEAPEWIGPELEFFQGKPKNFTKTTINIGGELFCTSKETLSASSFFTSYFSRWTDESAKTNQNIMFVDRNPEAFKHVLSYMRNPEYPFPSKFSYELEFYGIEPKIKNPPSASNQLEQITLDLIPFNRNYCDYNTLVSSGMLQESLPNGSCAFNRNIDFRLNPRGFVGKAFVQLHIPDSKSLKFLCPKKLIFGAIWGIELIINGMLVCHFTGDLLYIWMKLYYPEDYKLFVERLGQNYLMIPIHFMFTQEARDLYKSISCTMSIRLNIASAHDLLYFDADHSIPYWDLELNIRILYQDVPDVDQLSHDSNCEGFDNFHICNHPTHFENVGFLQGKNGQISKGNRQSVIEEGHSDYLQSPFKHLRYPHLEYVYLGEELFIFDDDHNSTGIIDIKRSNMANVIQLIFVIQANTVHSRSSFDYLNIIESATLYYEDMIIATIDPIQSILDRYIYGLAQDDTPIYIYTFGSPYKALSENNAVKLRLKLATSKIDKKTNEYIVKTWFIKSGHLMNLRGTHGFY